MPPYSAYFDEPSSALPYDDDSSSSSSSNCTTVPADSVAATPMSRNKTIDGLTVVSSPAVNKQRRKRVKKSKRRSAASVRKSVSFQDYVTLRNTIHRNDYTPEEKAATWINGEEFASMKEVRKQTLKIMSRAERAGATSYKNYGDDEDFCTRGLESKTRMGSRRKKFNMLEATMAVLDEQLENDMYRQRHDDHQPQSQYNDGISLVALRKAQERLASVYIARTSHCRAEASLRGRRDEIEAQKCYHDDA